MEKNILYSKRLRFTFFLVNDGLFRRKKQELKFGSKEKIAE